MTKDIQDQLTHITDKLEELYVAIGIVCKQTESMEKNIDRIQTTLYGNGQLGLVTKTNIMYGVLGAIAAVLTIGLGNGLASLLKLWSV